MRLEGETSEYLTKIGVNRSRIGIILMLITFVSVYITVSILYDSAICNLKASDLYENRMKEMSLHFNGENNELYESRESRRRLPQALIIGVRKGGTRALLEMMVLHPSVRKATAEIHFFDRDDNYKYGLEWYKEKMPPSTKEQITIEKSPSYFIEPEVPERVRAMNSSIKLIIIVRDPVVRAISDYTQTIHRPPTISSNVTQKPKTSYQKSFEELAVRPDGTINVSYRPLSISLYHKHFHRWLDIFPRHQIWIVNGDKLIVDPVPELRKVEHFLGLEPKIHRGYFLFNSTKGFYCMKHNSGYRCLKESKGRKHPNVNSRVLSKLRQFFSEHNQKFYDLVGENFGWLDH